MRSVDPEFPPTCSSTNLLIGMKTANVPSMKNLRRVAFTVLLALGIGMSTGGAQAATTLDQSFELSNTGYTGLSGQPEVNAQMVTPGVTGALTSVQVSLVKSGTPTEGVTVSIRAASAGKPTGADLASVFIPDSAISVAATMITAAFASPPTVTAGTQFAIVVSSTNTNNEYGWRGSTTASYSGGRAAYYLNAWGFWDSPSGFVFRTYVTTQDAQWTSIPQGLPLSAAGTCDALDDKAVAYGTGLTGGWKRSWEPWVNTTIGANGQRIGGWACTRTLINKGGSTWTIAS